MHITSEQGSMFLVEDSRPSLGKTFHEIYKKRPFQNLASLSGKMSFKKTKSRDISKQRDWVLK